MSLRVWSTALLGRLEGEINFLNGLNAMMSSFSAYHFSYTVVLSLKSSPNLKLEEGVTVVTVSRRQATMATGGPEERVWHQQI